ncbi:MAG: hypothetical protein AMXMBFR12_10240 [Candidatus Babeliales bacterium]
MNKMTLMGLLLCTFITTLAIIEGDHSQIIRYKVLALVTTGMLEKDIVLSFDHQKETDDVAHAITQECARHGYELGATKHITLSQRPIVITHALYQIPTTVNHYTALVTVKRQEIQRPLVLEFIRIWGIGPTATAKDIQEWTAQDCAKQGYSLIEVQTIHKSTFHWHYFPEKYRHLLR